VNTSVTHIEIGGNRIDNLKRFSVNSFVARNKRLRRLFLFDARKMLLSLMCADECGVVWPYLLEKGDIDDMAAPDDIESILGEYLEVVAERRRRALQAGVVALSM
jgi:hypothetical protein